MFASIITVAQDLYGTVESSSSIAQTTARTATTTVINTNNSDNFLLIISNFNYFILAWSIFYSIVLYMNFYYWRLYRTADRLHHEAKGVKSIQDAWWIWFRYIHVLLLLTFAVDYKNFAILVFGLLFYFLRFAMTHVYTKFANGLLVVELLAVLIAIFTVRSDFTFMRPIFAILMMVNLFGIKFRFDFVAIMESLNQAFGQIGWKDDWPKKASKGARDFNFTSLKTVNMGNLLIISYMIAFLVISGFLLYYGI
jgi:hypothetical protein